MDLLALRVYNKHACLCTIEKAHPPFSYKKMIRSSSVPYTHGGAFLRIARHTSACSLEQFNNAFALASFSVLREFILSSLESNLDRLVLRLASVGTDGESFSSSRDLLSLLWYEFVRNGADLTKVSSSWLDDIDLHLCGTSRDGWFFFLRLVHDLVLCGGLIILSWWRNFIVDIAIVAAFCVMCGVCFCLLGDMHHGEWWETFLWFVHFSRACWLRLGLSLREAILTSIVAMDACRKEKVSRSTTEQWLHRRIRETLDISFSSFPTWHTAKPSVMRCHKKCQSGPSHK